MNQATLFKIKTDPAIISILRNTGIQEIGVNGIWLKGQHELNVLEGDSLEWIVKGLSQIIPKIIYYLYNLSKKHKNPIIINIQGDPNINVEIAENLTPDEIGNLITKILLAIK